MRKEAQSFAAPAAEETYRGADGKEMGYIAYRHSAPAARTALVYLHGIASHAGWFDNAAGMLFHKGYDVFCLDRRGSGVNRENRGFLSGHIDRYETLIQDVRSFYELIKQEYDHFFLIGLSWGGKLAMAYSLVYPRDFDGLVLVTPGFRAKADVSLWIKIKVLLSSWFSPRSPFDLPMKAEMFTRTPQHVQYLRNDPLRIKQATAAFLMQSRKLDRYIDARIVEGALPVLLFLAGKDQIIDNEGVARLLKRMGHNDMRTITYNDQVHSIQFDAPERMVEDIDEWLASQLERYEKEIG